MLAAKIIVTIENPGEFSFYEPYDYWQLFNVCHPCLFSHFISADVLAISARPYGQRAVLKYASYTGAQSIAGRFTPGTFTNQITKQFRQPRLLIVTDPRTDSQAVKEASYMNVPVIALRLDSPLSHVDCAIPVTNKENYQLD